MLIIDGILINAATVLTNGVFLSGYIVYLKGSDFLVGLLNNSAAWASIIAILSSFIYERMNKRKKFLISLNIISRALICSIVFLPLISNNRTFVLSAVSFMVILGNVLWCFYGIGSTVWMMNLVSKRARNEYINIRMLFLRISFTLASFLMGIVLDLFNKSYMGFLVVFTVSLVFSITDVIVLSKVEEPENRVAEKGRISLSGSSEPLRNAKYRAFLVFIFFYYLSLTMSSAYTSLYQIKYVKLDYSFISVVNVIANIMMVTCTRLWSRVERSRGLWFVLRVSSIFAASEFLIYSFLTERTYYILFFAPILAGIGNSGFNIAILSYRYELMPESNRTAYEGWYGATYGLSTLLAPVIGSFLMGKLPEINNIIYQYGKFQLLYLISFTSCILVIFMMFYRPRKTADVGGESAGI
ncbi:MFS transporter [Clostridium thermosuccinogenes]|uniref:MFS transporter n=1 Tax=Clostridium thermosuccinogenes TaxID=84032 RepID=UPI000CCC4B87|nr:MFS transporter [Pseudoclostridium thermosuccinogenes]PNT93538.1 hypothetical protein CDQ83_08565 [Pseudoclostridium thermosuccinogenes]